MTIRGGSTANDGLRPAANKPGRIRWVAGTADTDT
jgi:hypothetical protein